MKETTSKPWEIYEDLQIIIGDTEIVLLNAGTVNV